MDRKHAICLILGILFSILPGLMIGLIVLDFMIYFSKGIYSLYPPKVWILTGMLCLGVVLIVIGLDIKLVESTE